MLEGFERGGSKLTHANYVSYMCYFLEDIRILEYVI